MGLLKDEEYQKKLRDLMHYGIKQAVPASVFPAPMIQNEYRLSEVFIVTKYSYTNENTSIEGVFPCVELAEELIDSLDISSNGNDDFDIIESPVQWKAETVEELQQDNDDSLMVAPK